MTPVENTRLVDVFFVATDPVFAALALNTHLEAYVQLNLDRRLETTQGIVEWLDEELSKQGLAVEESERALTEYREQQNALSLDDDQNIVAARLMQLSNAVTAAEATRLQRETRYNQVRDLDPDDGDTSSFPAVAQHLGVVAAKQRLAQAEATLRSLSARYGPRHPDMIKTHASIASAREQLKTETTRAIESIQSEYQSALDYQRQLTAQLDEQKLAVQDLGRKEVGYSMLERHAQSNRRVFESVLLQQKQRQVVANSRVNNVQLMDWAQVPDAPFTPNTRQDWGYAIFFGLACRWGSWWGSSISMTSSRRPRTSHAGSACRCSVCCRPCAALSRR